MISNGDWPPYTPLDPDRPRLEPGEAAELTLDGKRKMLSESVPQCVQEPCEYCGNGVRTGLSGNACENCMNTGLKYPEREVLPVLLPCPFCGAPARTDFLPHAGGPGWVQCSACECDQFMSDTMEEAVSRWNTRAPASDLEITKADILARGETVLTLRYDAMLTDSDGRLLWRRFEDSFDRSSEALFDKLARVLRR